MCVILIVITYYEESIDRSIGCSLWYGQISAMCFFVNVVWLFVCIYLYCTCTCDFHPAILRTRTRNTNTIHTFLCSYKINTIKTVQNGQCFLLHALVLRFDIELNQYYYKHFAILIHCNYFWFTPQLE